MPVGRLELTEGHVLFERWLAETYGPARSTHALLQAFLPQLNERLRGVQYTRAAAMYQWLPPLTTPGRGRRGQRAHVVTPNEDALYAIAALSKDAVPRAAWFKSVERAS
jgi:hypothetical protein